MSDQEIDLKQIADTAVSISGRMIETSGRNGSKGWSKETPEKRVQITDEDIMAFASAMPTSTLNLDGADIASAMDPVVVPAPKPATGGGYKLDQGKPRWELAPMDAFEAVVKVQTWAINKELRGDKAYPERNWERGMHWSRVWGALMRHSWKWWWAKMLGPKLGFTATDDESGFSHAWHVATCACFLVSYELRGMDGFDDRPSVLAEEPKPK